MKERQTKADREFAEWLATIAPHVDAAIEAFHGTPGQSKGKRGHPAFGRPAHFKHKKVEAA